MVTTLREFVIHAAILNNDGIYDLFEDGITKELRNEILSLADNEVAEPVRVALNIIGRQYDVDSLINY